MDSIRLRGPADILAALPYQLGYHPRDALVVVALTGRAIGLVQRVDLPPPQRVGEAVEALLPALVREKPDTVLMVGYEARAGDSTALLDALGDAAPAHGIGVLDRLVVRDGRWYAPDCNDVCCPGEGTPLARPEDSPAVADFVGLEMGAVTDRGSLADQVAPDERVCREVATAVAAAAASWEADQRGGGASGPGREGGSDRATAVRRLRWLSLWAVVCDVSGARPPLEGLSAEELAALALSLHDVALRDGLIGWFCPGTLPLDALDEDLVDQLQSSLPDPAWAVQPATRESVVAGRRLSSRLAYLCRVVPDPQAAPMLTVLASFTWWLGDGALTRTALDRALAIEPEYRLALLLERMVDLAIRPSLSA